MIFNKILSLAASIIKLFISFLLITETLAVENSKKFYAKDSGVLSIMYHRFDENKYPSTNIDMNIFRSQIELIKKNNIEFYNPKDFSKEINKPKLKKKILLTIDDGFTSFYKNAWPYLRTNKIPFILFISTEPVGKNGYMTWSQIKEIEKEEFVFIGNHSHSHEYMVTYKLEQFKKDINRSIEEFKKQLGYNPIFFSYPFGEYNLEQKKFIKKNFQIAFGQHSGVIDVNKDVYELPRFPINEKYGDLDRFKFLINLNPLEYKSVSIKNKLLNKSNNPPDLVIEFFNDQKNLNQINCFSNEGGDWKETNIKLSENKLNVLFNEKFIPRRGRINCSMNENGTWRWLGLQFTIR